MKAKILVAEDDQDINDLIVMHLSREGHQIDSCTNGADAIKQLKNNSYDIAILDWMLPQMTGLEITKEVRKTQPHQQLKILMVTAKSTNSDIILGLESGADDYLTKPFELSVLMARARALLRRADKPTQSLVLGPIEINEAAHEAKMENEVLSLTPYEFKLLVTLIRNKGRVLTREKLIEEVQGEGVAVIERAIDTHVFGLRKKLGTSGDLIETVRGIGYRISATG